MDTNGDKVTDNSQVNSNDNKQVINSIQTHHQNNHQVDIPEEHSVPASPIKSEVRIITLIYDKYLLLII